MTNRPDTFDPAAFQALCARFGIEATLTTDAFGRTDFHLDRPNAEKLWAINQLIDADPSLQSGSTTP